MRSTLVTDEANTYEGSHCVRSPWKVGAEVGGKAAKYCANTHPYDCNEEAQRVVCGRARHSSPEPSSAFSLGRAVGSA